MKIHLRYTPLSVCHPEFAAAVWTGRCTRASSPPAAAAHAGQLPPSKRELETTSQFQLPHPPSSWLYTHTDISRLKAVRGVEWFFCVCTCVRTFPGCEVFLWASCSPPAAAGSSAVTSPAEYLAARSVSAQFKNLRSDCLTPTHRQHRNKVSISAHLVSDFSEDNTVLHVAPLVHLSLLLRLPPLLLGPPQFFGQRLQFSSVGQKLPPHLLLLPLLTHSHLLHLLLCHLQLEAVVFWIQTELLDLQ